jgi:ribosome biogenesis GTPase
MEERIATVVKNAGSHYLLCELPEWKPFPAVLRGKVRLKSSTATNPVAVGDLVRYIPAAAGSLPSGVRPSGSPHHPSGTVPPLSNLGSLEHGNVLGYSRGCYVLQGENLPPQDGPAIITEILPRRNYVIRKSTNLSRQAHVIAANLDQAVIAVSLFFPEIKLPFLDRILVTCEVYKIPVIIALNKMDLYREDAPEAVADFHRIYEGAGYRVIDTSCKTGEGIDELRQACSSRLTLFSGESGAGKSSIIKAIDPSLDIKIGQISLAHLQGKHTTSLYEMYRFSAGGENGYLIDSPGLRGFGLVDLEKEEIAKYFPEMLRVADNCRFTPCTHTHEPGCAVKTAVDSGEISAERYNSYLGMLEEDGKFRKG